MNEKNAIDGKQRILEVAEALFTESGYRAVSIRDIARACNLTNAALYYHFPNKAALFNQVMERHATRMADSLRAAGGGIRSPRRRLAAILAAYAGQAADRRSAFFTLRREMGDGEWREQHARLLQVMLAPLEEVFQEAVSQGKITPFPEEMSAAAVLVGMLHGAAMHRKAGAGKEIPEGDIAFLVDVFWNGLSPEKIEIQK